MVLEHYRLLFPRHLGDRSITHLAEDDGHGKSL